MMKKFILSIFASVAMTAIAQNEIVIGDMNEDGEITVSDITSLTEVAMGKASKRTINYCTEKVAEQIAKMCAAQAMEEVHRNYYTKEYTEEIARVYAAEAMQELYYRIYDLQNRIQYLESKLSNSRDKNDAETTWNETDEAGKEGTK